MGKRYNVVSLADGISTGQIALRKAGKQYRFYGASEIDKHAIKITQSNFPGTLQMGDMCKVKASRIPFDVDLLLSGSPCQVALVRAFLLSARILTSMINVASYSSSSSECCVNCGNIIQTSSFYLKMCA